MNTFTTICRRIKIWWKTPCYYSIANGMPPVYESEEELQELLTDLKKQTDKKYEYEQESIHFYDARPRHSGGAGTGD